MKCNFSQNGYCCKFAKIVNCNGESQKEGCPSWVTIELLARFADR